MKAAITLVQVCHLSIRSVNDPTASSHINEPATVGMATAYLDKLIRK